MRNYAKWFGLFAATFGASFPVYYVGLFPSGAVMLLASILYYRATLYLSATGHTEADEPSK